MFGLVFFFKDAATTGLYTLSLHDALPIWGREWGGGGGGNGEGMGREWEGNGEEVERGARERDSTCSEFCR